MSAFCSLSLLFIIICVNNAQSLGRKTIPFICYTFQTHFIEYLDCPRGYHFHPMLDACYKMTLDQRLTYDQANNICIHEGATLASIENRIEDSYLDCQISLNTARII